MALGLLGQTATLGIGLAVYLDDQFTQGSARITQSLQAMNKDVDDFSQGMRTIERIGDGLSRFGDRVIGFARSASSEFNTFEHSINATGIIAGLQKNDEGFKTLGDNAQRLSGIYGQLPDAIAQAELEISKGGKSVAQIKEMTEAVVALGAATGTGVSGSNGTATVLLNIMQAYNASGKEALHYADIITSAANQSTIDVRDLYESLRYSADVASTLKIPFEETAASIATLGNAGLKGSMAGTAYANMLRYIESGIGVFATKRQQTAIGLLGITKKDMLDEQGHLISMSNLLKLLRERTQGFSDNDKLNVLQGIVGVRGNRALLNLLNGRDRDTKGNEMSSFDAMQDKIHQDTLHNITQNTARRMTDDSLGNISKLTAAWSNFKIAFGATLATTLAPVIKGLTSILVRLTEFIKGDVGSWLVRWGVILLGSMSPIGRMISMGARFAGFLVTSAGSLTNAFSMARVAATSIKAQLMAGAVAIQNAALRARGITARFNSTYGVHLLQGRGSNGRFQPAVPAGRMATGLGMLFGATGLRWAASISRMMAPLTTGITWLTRTLGVVRTFGTVLGKALGWLFGWEALLLDLGLTLITGKGLFEWLWTGFRALFGWIFGWENEGKKAKIKHAQPTEERFVKIDRRTAEEKRMEARFMKDNQYKGDTQQPITLNIAVAPNNTDKTVRQKIDVDLQRQINSHAIGQ